MQVGYQESGSFSAFIYTKGWIRAPSAAPNNDLIFLKTIQSYSSFDPEISAAVLQKFTNDLWYLSKKLVCLTLFDDSVSLQIKK